MLPSKKSQARKFEKLKQLCRAQRSKIELLELELRQMAKIHERDRLRIESEIKSYAGKIAETELR